MAEYIERSAAIRALTLHDCDSADAKIVIRDIPAADVAPVVHGRWVIDRKNHCYCSHCGMVRNIKTQIGWKYCPICNAKMDKEATNGD